MPGDTLSRIRALLTDHPVIDGHNDLPWEARERVAYDWDRLDIAVAEQPTHTDVPRLREGGVGGQFWSVFVPARLQGEPRQATLEQVDGDRAIGPLPRHLRPRGDPRPGGGRDGIRADRVADGGRGWTQH